VTFFSCFRSLSGLLHNAALAVRTPCCDRPGDLSCHPYPCLPSLQKATAAISNNSLRDFTPVHSWRVSWISEGVFRRVDGRVAPFEFWVLFGIGINDTATPFVPRPLSCLPPDARAGLPKQLQRATRNEDFRVALTAFAVIAVMFSASSSGSARREYGLTRGARRAIRLVKLLRQIDPDSPQAWRSSPGSRSSGAGTTRAENPAEFQRILYERTSVRRDPPSYQPGYRVRELQAAFARAPESVTLLPGLSADPTM